jgi:DNA (cytosine-5)-methyltransferase 1
MSECVVSFFSGAGGLSLGFANAGIKPVFGVDINSDACSTYESNLGIPCHHLDLSNKDFSKLLNLLAPYQDVLAVIGGPPCQGFSTAGNRNKFDPRNQLIFNYFAIVEQIRPKWFLFENVEGLLTSNNGKSIFDLVSRFIKLGYSLRLEKVNFAAYGLPQSRKRVIIIGNRLGAEFNFPFETHSFDAGKHNRLLPLFPNSPTLSEAISGLPEASKRECLAPYTSDKGINEYDTFMRLFNQSGGVKHHFSSPSNNDLERYKLLKCGQTMKDLPEILWHPSYRKRAFRRVLDGMPTEKRGGAPVGIKRLHSNQCSPTITSASSRELIHPLLDRSLTLRECARLQSFGDEYVFKGTTSSIATQLGNAFPPLAAKLFAQLIMQVEGTYGSNKGSYTVKKAQLLGYRLTDALGMSPTLMQTDSLLKLQMSNQIEEKFLHT